MGFIILVLMIGSILFSWIKGINNAKKLPAEVNVLKSHIKQTFIFALIIGSLLGLGMSAQSIAFADVSMLLGLIVGGISTFVLSGFILHYRTNRLLKEHQYISDPSILDEHL